MRPKWSFPDRLKEAITTYGPTATSVAQLGLYLWYVLRHGSTT